jgi:histidine triad (HIT) family protein
VSETVFTRIIEGELPARFVWRDERCVAFLSINPLREGHTLVVPREPIDHWLDLPPDLAAHLMDVSQKIGRALQRAYEPEKVGVVIAGLEVPHVHIHLTPIDELEDLDFRNAATDPDPQKLDDAAEKIRQALADLGFGDTS